MLKPTNERELRGLSVNRDGNEYIIERRVGVNWAGDQTGVEDDIGSRENSRSRESSRSRRSSRSSSESSLGRVSVSDGTDGEREDSVGSSCDGGGDRDADGESVSSQTSGDSLGSARSRLATPFVDFRNPDSWSDSDMLLIIGIFPDEFSELCRSIEGCSTNRMLLKHNARVFLFMLRYTSSYSYF